MDGDLPVWPEERTDLKLQIAETAARKSGVITPLLKEELWTKIQHSRLERGLDELKVEVKEHEQTPLTSEEKTKVAHRREKNREAAVRCRQKRKSKQRELEQILDKEIERKKCLTEKYQTLLDQKHWLMSELGLTPTSPPNQESARLWIPTQNQEHSCIWTPHLKEESAHSWTPPPQEEPAHTWTPPPKDEPAYTWTPPPNKSGMWTPPTPWCITPPPKEKGTCIWTQQTPADEEACPPPPECFSWLDDELQVVPGEGCSTIHL
ncbi:uncharacterized protein LOC117324252 isoform X2 [Pecten maximus]|nr:uncharacterized protein LOC117324252 isoform X2 [Pecten maximus]